MSGGEIRVRDMQGNKSESRELAELLPETVFEMDRDGNITFLNSAAFDKFGYSREDLAMGLTATQFLIPEERDVAMENIERILGGERLPGREYRALRKDGSTFPAIIHASAIVHQNRAVGLRGIVVDVSGYRGWQARLRQTEERHRNTLDSMIEGCHLLGPDWRYLYVNDSIVRHTGLNRSELVGCTIMDVYPGVEETEMFAAMRRCMEQRIPQRIETEFVARRDGSKGWFVLSIHPVPEGVFVLALDITERRRAEEALRHSEEKLRRMFESVSEGITVVDLDNTIVDLNEETAKLHGFSSKDELVGKNAIELVAHRDRERVLGTRRETFRGASGIRMECKLLRADSSEFEGEVSVSMLRNSSGDPVGFIGVTRDVSEQKRLRQNIQFYIREITKAQEEERQRVARELHDETAQALAALSHEMDAIARDEQQQSEEIRLNVKRLRAKVDGILEGVRRFSHELRPQILDQLGLLPALEFLVGQLNERGVVDARIEVTGCERRLAGEVELVLFRIAQEALRNIEKHSQATEVLASVDFSRDAVEMQVTDNGKGFKVPPMLGDFARIGKLGMIGMQERCRLVGGSLSVKSAANSGTTVVVEVSPLPS